MIKEETAGMNYKVNDIFYSLQGEGHHVGRAAVFVRFAGCNLRCPFCDTEFDSFQEMTEKEILKVISPYPSRFVVLTGGEPTLQVDESLVDLFHQKGYTVAMESNGTHAAPQNIDWLTVSPKYAKLEQLTCNELKLVFTEANKVNDYGVKAEYYFLQPCDTGNVQRNALILNSCVDYIKSHPQWQLSLQMHKLIGIQ